MVKKYFLYWSILLFTFNYSVYSQNKLEKLFSEGFFTEGPAYGPDNNIYFSDQTFTSETNMLAGIIWKYDSQTGKTSVYRSPSGMANGIEFDKEGLMIICEGADFGGRKIISTDIKTGKSKIITALFNNLPYNSPNDLIIDSKNRIYFTDPRYIGYEKLDQPCFGVYKIEKDGNVRLLINDIPMPNGIAVSPDENKLYVGCNYEGDESKNIKPVNCIYEYNLDTNGNISNKKEFIKYPDAFGPDGIIVDDEGNLYVALRDEDNPGIYIYNKNAHLFNVIPLPEVPSNLTFGKGKDINKLFITAGGSLYKIDISKK